MKEVFKKIEGYERYSVSNYGRVINNITGHELSQRKATNGYLRVNLRTGTQKYEKPHVASVHRLVAAARALGVDERTIYNSLHGMKNRKGLSFVYEEEAI